MIGNIGEQLRLLRKQSGLTLAEVAEQTNLSIAFISNVERNLCSPTLDNLQRICSALDTSLLTLLEIQQSESKVIRSNSRDIIFEEKNQIRYEAINFGPAKMEGLVIIIEPQCGYDKMWPHDYDEIGLVLEGELTINLNDAQFDLKKGDAFYIDAMTEHSLSNHSDSRCFSYWVKQNAASQKKEKGERSAPQARRRNK